jgi:hypothetical protein
MKTFMVTPLATTWALRALLARNERASRALNFFLFKLLLHNTKQIAPGGRLSGVVEEGT